MSESEKNAKAKVPQNRQRQIASSMNLGARLVEAGLLPVNCRRFIIDCPPPNEGPVKIYFDCYGDVEQLEVVFDEIVRAVRHEQAEKSKVIVPKTPIIIV